jgi:general secretion pathway protein D
MTRRARTTFLLTAAALLSSCAQTPKETLAPLPPMPVTAAGPQASRVSGTVASGKANLPPSAATYGRTPSTPPLEAASNGGGKISLNFVDTDIRQIARTVLGKVLKVTYTIDPNVHGSGTIQTAQPISRERALTILENLLAQNGATISVINGVYQVRSNQAAALSANLVGATAAGTGTKMVQLRYASAADLAKVLTPFLTPGAKVVPDPTRNVLLVTGDPDTRDALIQVIRAFDVDYLAGKSFALFPVESGQPEKVTAELNKVLGSGAHGALAAVVQVVPMDRINAVLVVTSQPQYIADVRRLFALVDRVGSETVRSWHVYYVHNGRSETLAYDLQRAFTPNDVTATGVADTNHLNNTVPGLQIGQANSSSSSSNPSSGHSGMLLDQQSSGTTSANAGGQHPEPARPPATAPLSPGTSPETKDQIRIIADQTNNALMIYATPQEYSMIQGLLSKIDILPLQVEINAVIAEVTLNSQLQYGVQFYFKNGGLSALLSQNSSTTTGLPFSFNFPGFVLQNASGEVNLALSALQAVTKVRVLSSPQITVLDNQPATLEVGDQVPYLTQQASYLQGGTTAGTPIVNSVAYQETGVILRVIPRINSGGLVTLDIAQEVSEPVTTTSSGIDSPTFSDRVIKSRVVAQDGQTIGLAGLISDNTSRSNGGIPVVKDIPIVGTLFSNQNNQRTRTELLVLITPHVDYNQRVVRALTDDLRGKLWHAGLVPQELNALRPSGSANPNGRLRINLPTP